MFDSRHDSDDATRVRTAVHSRPDLDDSTIIHHTRHLRRNTKETDIQLPETPASAEVIRFSEVFEVMVRNVSQVIFGKEDAIRLAVTAFFANGHLLLEDTPGTGKTQLARSLAASVDADYKRLQFTPDLLPSDVIGVTFYDSRSSTFTFRPGPIFASIVLADEINRASPKTQSALLEVMEEHHVTIDGTTHSVPEPFIVIATQNPVEQVGTYDLPEAQRDRFLMKISLGHPSHSASLRILHESAAGDRVAALRPVVEARRVAELRSVAESVTVDDAIVEYVTRLLERTRHDDAVAVGASIRGGLALIRCARILAAADARMYVTPADIQTLAVPVLAHRVIMTPQSKISGTTAQAAISAIVDDVAVPTVGTGERR